LGEDIMTELQLTLTAEERQFLADLLTQALKDTRIEEHRTRTLSYRQHILHNEEVIAGLLGKLGRPDGGRLGPGERRAPAAPPSLAEGVTGG
jgi:hypothetical protein